MSLLEYSPAPISDCQSQLERFRADFLSGLRSRPRTLPPKYFYDAEGSRLFDRICELEEYFPTRTEIAILSQNRAAIRAAVGLRQRIVEFGSGSGLKTRLLFDALENPRAYIPVEISRSALNASAQELARRYPRLEILPVCADYTQGFELPRGRPDYQGTTIFFPGSTIGNFLPEQAIDFLSQARRACGDGCSLLLGAGLQTDPYTLERAYNDAQGVTAAFNRNLLWRAKRELGARVNPERFHHQARYDRAEGRIEMRLISAEDQVLQLDEEAFHFLKDDSILTEISQKFTHESLTALAYRAGFHPRHAWTDPQSRFAVYYFSSH